MDELRNQPEIRGMLAPIKHLTQLRAQSTKLQPSDLTAKIFESKEHIVLISPCFETLGLEAARYTFKWIVSEEVCRHATGRTAGSSIFLKPTGQLEVTVSKDFGSYAAYVLLDLEAWNNSPESCIIKDPLRPNVTQSFPTLATGMASIIHDNGLVGYKTCLLSHYNDTMPQSMFLFDRLKPNYFLLPSFSELCLTADRIDWFAEQLTGITQGGEQGELGVEVKVEE